MISEWLTNFKYDSNKDVISNKDGRKRNNGGIYRKVSKVGSRGIPLPFQ